jgi:ABC-2 type transport system permease protein
MIALLRKDLLVLSRSRLLVALLVIYPVAIALLIGLAISRSPSKPRVAIVDETPPGQTFKLGNQQLSVGKYANSFLSQANAIKVPTRAQALAKVASGEVLAAIVIPPDIISKISSGIQQAHVEVIYNGDALEQSLVHTTLGAALAQANLQLSQEIKRVAIQELELLREGGELNVLGSSQRLLGLGRIPVVLEHVARQLPRGHERTQVEHVANFASFAAKNLGLSKDVLQTVSQPIAVQEKLLHGRRTPLDTFAVVVAASVSLMFVCVLLAAGGVAHEREEHVLARLVRSPPALLSRSGLLIEKILLAAGCAFVVAFGLLAGVGIFVSLDWGRVGQWLIALAAGALAFGSLGVAIGVLAREVRAASLLAFLLSLPLAFLALVPSGAVASGLNTVIQTVSLLFPYKAALQALDAAVNGASPGLGISLLHLLVLTLAFTALARLGLRRLE